MKMIKDAAWAAHSSLDVQLLVSNTFRTVIYKTSVTKIMVVTRRHVIPKPDYRIHGALTRQCRYWVTEVEWHHKNVVVHKSSGKDLPTNIENNRRCKIQTLVCDTAYVPQSLHYSADIMEFFRRLPLDFGHLRNHNFYFLFCKEPHFQIYFSLSPCIYFIWIHLFMIVCSRGNRRHGSKLPSLSLSRRIPLLNEP